MVSIDMRPHNLGMARSTFGAWLKRERLRRNMTQGELEKRAGLSFAYVSRVEKGTQLPAEETRQRIHNVFGTSDEDLAEVGVLARLDGVDGSPIYVRPEAEVPMPESDLDILRAYIKSGEIDEKAAGEILDWWSARKRLMGEG